MARPQRFCIFCRKPGLTYEHVWPDWLKKYVPKDMTEYSSLSVIVHQTHSEPRRKKRSGDPRSRRLRVVCKPCNTGWMGKLQERAKSYLLPLIHGDAASLDTTAQTAVSAWITMFVMVAEYFDPSKVATSQEQRSYFLENGTPPSNWKIWIGDYDRGNWAGHLVHFAVPILSEHHIPEIMDNYLPRPNTQTMTFTVGRLYGHVASSVTDIFENWRLTRTDLLAQIWSIAWPLITMTDRDADQIAAAFHHMSDEVARRGSDGF
jgi:hypothetical protein